MRELRTLSPAIEVVRAGGTLPDEASAYLEADASIVCPGPELGDPTSGTGDDAGAHRLGLGALHGAVNAGPRRGLAVAPAASEPNGHLT